MVGGAGEVPTSCARKEVKASVDKSVLFSWNWATAAVGSYFFLVWGLTHYTNYIKMHVFWKVFTVYKLHWNASILANQQPINVSMFSISWQFITTVLYVLQNWWSTSYIFIQSAYIQIFEVWGFDIFHRLHWNASILTNQQTVFKFKPAQSLGNV